MPNATNTTVNAGIISGIVPSGSGYYSGGVENFPRFLEDWSGKTFTYYGSMLELRADWFRANGGGTTPQPVIVIIRRHGPIIIDRRFPTGTLAFTGSSSFAALVALEALLVGAALMLVDPERTSRRASHINRRRSKSFLSVTLPK